MQKSVNFGKYGKLTFNSEGFVQCHICGKYYHGLGHHVTQAHNITAKEYRRDFGLDLNCRLSSEDLVKKRRSLVSDKSLENLSKGEDSRFKKGHNRTESKYVSPQTRERLCANSTKYNKKRKKIKSLVKDILYCTSNLGFSVYKDSESLTVFFALKKDLKRAIIKLGDFTGLSGDEVVNICVQNMKDLDLCTSVLIRMSPTSKDGEY